MRILHEILAVEKVKNEAADTLLRETGDKFGKPHFFQGFKKSLNMLKESPENTAIENAGAENRALPTTVYDTLEYMLGIWAEAEDIQFMKNVANTKALADITLASGLEVAKGVPVDELLGLEARLGKIKGLFLRMPTIDAAVEWVQDQDAGKHVFRTKHPTVTTKGEKKIYPVILHPATDKHPAQVREASKDETVGTFTKIEWSGAVTAVQKSEAIKRVDDMINAVKAARMRANKMEVEERRIGAKLVELLLEPLK